MPRDDAMDSQFIVGVLADDSIFSETPDATTDRIPRGQHRSEHPSAANRTERSMSDKSSVVSLAQLNSWQSLIQDYARCLQSDVENMQICDETEASCCLFDDCVRAVLNAKTKHQKAEQALHDIASLVARCGPPGLQPAVA